MITMPKKITMPLLLCSVFCPVYLAVGAWGYLPYFFTQIMSTDSGYNIAYQTPSGYYLFFTIMTVLQLIAAVCLTVYAVILNIKKTIRFWKNMLIMLLTLLLITNDPYVQTGMLLLINSRIPMPTIWISHVIDFLFRLVPITMVVLCGFIFCRFFDTERKTAFTLCVTGLFVIFGQSAKFIPDFFNATTSYWQSSIFDRPQILLIYLIPFIWFISSGLALFFLLKGKGMRGTAFHVFLLILGTACFALNTTSFISMLLRIPEIWYSVVLGSFFRIVFNMLSSLAIASSAIMYFVSKRKAAPAEPPHIISSVD